MTRTFEIAAALTTLFAMVVSAQPVSASEPPARAASFQQVLDCRSVKADAERLTCYDAAAGRLDEAEHRGDIVVIDRAQASAAHREAFGLLLPSLDFVTKALKPDEVSVLTGSVRAVRADVNGNWTLSLEGGAVWRQISGQLLKPPRAGSKVRIRKGMIGSYLMNVDDQPSIKVHRDQ